jgi:hypothetical protein
MGKIINPVSYRKMAEKFTRPAYSYSRIKEGVGAGYQLTFIDIKLTNVKVGKTEKDGDGFNVAKFTADIVPGRYGWHADHPYWTAASKGNPDPYNFDSSDNPFVSKAVITGGKVEGTCDDGGTAWRSEGSPWSEEQFIKEIESEEFIIQDSYSGGWVLSSMKDTLEWENEVRPGYEKYIDDTPSERGNLAVIEKISFNFDPEWVMDYNEAINYAMNPDEYKEDEWDDEEDEWDDADDDESPAFYDDPDSGRQWYESRRHPDPDKWKKGDWVIYKGKRYVTSLFMGGDMVKLESPDESIVVPQSEVYKATKKDIYGESKMREYSSSRSIKNYKPQHDFKKTKKYQDDEGLVGDIVKIVGVECGNSAVPASRRGLLGVKYDFSKRPEFKDYKKKGLEQEFSDFKNALGHKGEIVKTLPENSHIKKSFIIKVLDGPSKDKEFEFYPGEFYVIKGRLDNKYRFRNYEESKKESKSEDIKYLKYLLRKEEVTALDDEERWELQDLINKYGYPEGYDESKEFTGKKLKEDALSSQVRQSVLDVQAAKKQVNEDVAVLDKKVDKVSNDLVRIATNRRDVISEAKTRFVELDSPLKILGNGKIDEIEVKKILRKLAADRILRVNAHYNIKDSEGKVTYWDFLHSQDEEYQYVFVQEMTGNYCYSNMLYLNKKKGKIDLKNTKWSSYEIPEDCYDRYKMTEASRLTHKIVLKPENSGYRLTYPDKLRFHSKEDAENKLAKMNASMGSRLASKGLHLEIEEIPYTPRPRDTRTQDPDYENPFEVGDILEGDFGYSMILPVWVQVISKTAKTVTVRRLEDKVVSHDGYGQAGTKRPIPNSFAKGWGDSYEEKKCIVKKGYNRDKSDNPKKDYFILFEGKILRIWDGEDRDFDTYD